MEHLCIVLPFALFLSHQGKDHMAGFAQAIAGCQSGQKRPCITLLKHRYTAYEIGHHFPVKATAGERPSVKYPKKVGK